jgi:DNA repair protein RecN (Recombination protein N)
MLTALCIRDFAIIDELEVNFDSGLNILTGETGAGKSIIIDALSLALGSRASTDMIRSRANEAEVEALFSLSDTPSARDFLKDREWESGEELVIRRTLSAEGRHRIWINGRQATQGMLYELGRRLVDIYGQHEYQTLLRPERHLLLLDDFGNLKQELAEYQDLYQQYLSLKQEKEKLELDEKEKKEREDFLRYRIRELKGANLKPGEEDDLRAERERLRHAESLKDAVVSGAEILYDGDEALSSRLHELTSRLKESAIHDPGLGRLAQELSSAATSLEDIGRELRVYVDRYEADPERLLSIDDRLADLSRLKRKYSSGVEEMLSLLEKSRQELDNLILHEERLKELEGGLKNILERCINAGKVLRERRKESASRLSKMITGSLKQLAMAGTRFEARFDKSGGEEEIPGPAGLDEVEFWISPNPGEELKPLVKIASGGELSRIMLAMKGIVVRKGEVGTLVFDEVDAGIGGAVAEEVGRKMKDLAGGHQVLCVTHLPQIAKFADAHFRVSKTEKKKRAVTRVEMLSTQERVEELARMLAGAEITESSLAHAREMVEGRDR